VPTEPRKFCARRVSTSASSDKPHELGPDWGLFFWLLARYLDPVSNESLHERRAQTFSELAREAGESAVWVTRHLTTAEITELGDLERLGETHASMFGIAARLASFGLAEPGTVRAGAWKLTPWGKLVAQAAKAGAQ
jgi:hypothetical protein